MTGHRSRAMNTQDQRITGTDGPQVFPNELLSVYVRACGGSIVRDETPTHSHASSAASAMVQIAINLTRDTSALVDMA